MCAALRIQKAGSGTLAMLHSQPFMIRSASLHRAWSGESLGPASLVLSLQG